MTIGFDRVIVERVLLVAASLAVAAEIGSRWWIRRWSRYYMWPPGQRYRMVQDLRVFPQMERDALIEINAEGERGNPVPRNDGMLFRALVVGGSTVECLALDQPTSWPGALERQLGSVESLRVVGARNVHVGSIGRSGIASRHLNVILKRMLPQYPHLQAIVIMIGGNDVFQWLAAGTPVDLPQGPATALETFACHPEQPFGWKPKQWAAVEVARRLCRLWLRPVKMRNLAWVVTARQMRAAAKEIRSIIPDPAVMLDSFERHFRQILARAQRHADRVLVVRQPWFEKQYTSEDAVRCWQGGMGDAWNQRIDVYYSLGVVNGLMGLVNDRAAAIADELGVDFLDLRPVLAPTFDNYYDFIHFTPAGSAAVAQAVAEALLHAPAGFQVTRSAPPRAP